MIRGIYIESITEVVVVVADGGDGDGREEWWKRTQKARTKK